MSLVQVESTRSVLQDQVSSLEGSLTSLEEEGCKLRESLDLGKQCVHFLEDKEKDLSVQMELQESQVKHFTGEVSEVRHRLQLEIGHSADYWGQGFIDGFNPSKLPCLFDTLTWTTLRFQ